MDSTQKFEYFKKRLSAMDSDRGTWEDHWQEILDYVMPRKAENHCKDGDVNVPCKLAASKLLAVIAVESNNISLRFSPFALINVISAFLGIT